MRETRMTRDEPMAADTPALPRVSRELLAAVIASSASPLAHAIDRVRDEVLCTEEQYAAFGSAVAE